MKKDAVENRIRILKSYSVLRIYRPDAPHIERWIDRDTKVIYINIGAKPDAKIVRLV